MCFFFCNFVVDLCYYGSAQYRLAAIYHGYRLLANRHAGRHNPVNDIIIIN